MKRSEYRVRVKERYQQLNVWDEFVKLRARYASFGLAPAQTFEAATREIDRLYPNGKPKSSDGGIPHKNKGLPPIMDEIRNEDAVQRLVKASMGREAPPLKVFMWVYNHAGIPWDSIVPDDVPSPGAVYQLGQIKADSRNYQKFLTDFAKLLPSRSQLEEVEGRRSDDGRKQFALLDAMEREIGISTPSLSE